MPNTTDTAERVTAMSDTRVCRNGIDHRAASGSMDDIERARVLCGCAPIVITIRYVSGHRRATVEPLLITGDPHVAQMWHNAHPELASEVYTFAEIDGVYSVELSEDIDLRRACDRSDTDTPCECAAQPETESAHAPAVAPTYAVVARIQSPGNAPVDIRYGVGVSAIRVASAVASILDDYASPDTEVPECIRTSLLSITVNAL